MAIVVDANLLVVLINGDPRGEQLLTQFTDWMMMQPAFLMLWFVVKTFGIESVPERDREFLTLGKCRRW